MARRKVINDRYELQRLPLARGGMGEVWVGYDSKLDREIAVKFVRFQDGVPEQELVRRFVREARITARLHHPGVPAVFDVGTEEGRPYLLMQRVLGTSVSDLLAEHERLPVGWAVAIAAQACAVLAVAHEASLVHRDLKPANLMLEPDGTVKVLDFGLAVGLDLADASQITRSGQTIGTPAYMAPEQVLAAMSGPQTDLYALGCTLYEMLTGQQLFTGATSYSVMNKQVDEIPPPARERRPEVPAGLDALLGSLLEKKPENRPESAQAAYEQLLPYVTDLGPIPGVLNPPALPSPVRMYATVMSRTFTTAPAEEAEPVDDAEPVEEKESGPAGSGVDEAPAAAGPGTGEPRTGGTRVATRADLEETRAVASELATQARYKEAAGMLEDTLQQAHDSFGRLDQDVLNMRLEWANVLFEGGNYRAAAPVYEALTADLRQRDGHDAELVFRCRNQYIECRAELGNMDTALAAAGDLLADALRVYGRCDPRTIELRKKIGKWQLGAGQQDDAQQTFHTLLDDLIRNYGEEHPAVSQIRNLLAHLSANG